MPSKAVFAFMQLLLLPGVGGLRPVKLTRRAVFSPLEAFTSVHELSRLGTNAGAQAIQQLGNASVRVAVYSVNVGGYDDSVPYNCTKEMAKIEAKNIEVTCFFICDSQDMAESAKRNDWIPIIVPAGPKEHLKRESRVHKFMAEPMWNYTEYDILLYHDSNCIPIPQQNFSHRLLAVIGALADPAVDLVVFKHPFRETVAQEAKDVRELGLCTRESIHSLLEHFSEETFPDDLLLSENNVFARKWGSKRSERLDRTMQLAVDTMTTFGCFRDQLSLNYAVWKTGPERRILEMSQKPFAPTSASHSDPLGVRLDVPEMAPNS